MKPLDMRLSASLGVVLFSVACNTRPAVHFPDTSELEVEAAPAPKSAPASEGREEPPDDVVERAALPFVGYDVAAQKELAPEELFARLSSAHAICVGEQHDNPHHHFAQLSVLRELARRTGMVGRSLALGLEMFQSPFQEALHRYAAGYIAREELIEETEYAERWGYAFAYYAPLLEFSRAHGLSLLALNAPREITRRVARSGLEELDEEDREKLPELDFENSEHRQAFEAAMQGHPHTGMSLDALYTAQVIWDEWMADQAARYLAGGFPARSVVIVAGIMHCARPAIVSRIERRLPVRALAVRPLLVAPEAADARGDLDGFDFALLFSREPPSDAQESSKKSTVAVRSN